MAIKFVPCTSIEQADEMYWAGLLYFGMSSPWHPNEYGTAHGPNVILRLKVDRTYFGGYLVED